jgi:hypothetical protein
MKDRKYLIALMILALSMFGVACSDGGSDSDDASDACFDVCSRVGDCEVEGFSENGCNELCDELNDDDANISGNCDDALIGLFECAEDASCEEIRLGLEGGIFDDVEDLILTIASECEEEGAVAVIACAEELAREVDR